MKKWNTTLLVFLIAGISSGQNLVSNPGFENYSSLPNGIAQYYLAIGWNNCNGGGSPDYFSNLGSGQVQLPNCFLGNVSPHTGDGCMGGALYYISPDFREYISSQLVSPLVVGQTYNVNFYITNGVTAGVYAGGGVDQISAAFSTQPLTQSGSGPIPVVPQVTYGTIFYSYTWQLLSMQFIADSAYQYITIGNFFPDAGTSFQVFDACSNPGAYYFFDDIEVSVANAAPIALFSAPNHICPGTCTGFNNLSINATSFLWTFPGANPSVSVDTNPVNICYNTPGNYSVQLIASNTVTSDTLTLTNYITVYPYPPPQGILQNGDSLIANQGSVTYQWYYNGSIIPGATDYYYIAPQSGDYNVVCTDANDCEVEAAIFDVVAGMNPAASASEQLQIYPNPVVGNLEIRIPDAASLKSEGTGEISIYNILGGKIFDVCCGAFRNGYADVDCRALPPGTYWLQVISGEKTLHVKFLKQ